MTEGKGRKQHFLSKGFIGLGVMLLLGAGGLTGYNQWQDYRAGMESHAAAVMLVEQIQYKEISEELPDNTLENSDISTNTQMQETDKKEAAQAVRPNSESYLGILSIPKLERLLPVQNNWSMPRLKQSPCRYSGSLAEGELVIAAHNYKAHFAGLATLSQGDAVVFTDLEGEQTFYAVEEICTVEAVDIDGMVSSGYDLSLFTCNYGGEARITVRCTKSKA